MGSKHQGYPIVLLTAKRFSYTLSHHLSKPVRRVKTILKCISIKQLIKDQKILAAGGSDISMNCIDQSACFDKDVLLYRFYIGSFSYVFFINPLVTLKSSRTG